jgi:hypothetical protein
MNNYQIIYSYASRFKFKSDNANTIACNWSLSLPLDIDQSHERTMIVNQRFQSTGPTGTMLLNIVYMALRNLPLLTGALNELWQIPNYDTLVRRTKDRRIRNIPGSWNGKSKPASIIAKKIHHPQAQVTNVKAPAAVCNLPANTAFPLLSCQYAPAKQPNAHTSVKKMRKKTTLVRRERIM